MAAPSDTSKRDLILDAVNHRDTGRIPYVIFFQQTIARRLAVYFGAESIADVADNSVEWIGNALSNERMENQGILKDSEYTDEWGVRWMGVGETRGQVMHAPLEIPTLEGYPFPGEIPADILAQMILQSRGNAHRYRVAKLGALWEQATFLRGMEELLVDLMLNPGFVHELLDCILAVLMTNLDTFQCELDLDCIWLSDDYGTQQNLIMSPSLWREFIKPRLKLLCDTVHNKGYHFVLHSDGAIGTVIPDIVDIGVDILHPLQSECVNVGWVKCEYGSCLTIWGGYGSQRTLAFGSPGQVRREVHELCDELGRGGGFILTPGLSIQNDVPLENAVAFIEAAIECERGIQPRITRKKN